MKNRPTLAPLDIQQRYTPEEVGAYLRISRQKVFNYIASGALPSFKEGKRRFVSGAAIARAGSQSLAAAETTAA